MKKVERESDITNNGDNITIKDLYEMLKPLIDDGFGDSLIVSNNRYLNDSLFYQNSKKILFIGVSKKYDEKSSSI